ncbi:MAG TPA: homoserine O-acetyltransferase [Chloroflexota bacterium]|nr:homoserine O-acetyltransferase [Chloroflexota bacterium]
MSTLLPTAGSVGNVRTQYATIVEDLDGFELESGVRLGPITLAYQTYGTLNAARNNVILALHALSGDAHAAGISIDDAPSASDDGFGADEKSQIDRKRLGWWDDMIGPGKAFDTNRYFVISSNVIGGCRGSTGPISIDPRTGKPYGLTFPVVTIGDMVRAQKLLLDKLGISEVLAVTGGSMGGMQALDWTVRYPGIVRSCIPIASTAQLAAQGIAFNEVGRQAIKADPNWHDGNYYGGPAPAQGLAIARMIGHITYLSDESMHKKFGRRLRERERYGYDFSLDFEVESYLRYQGERFTQRFDANTYLYITKAIDYFNLAAPDGDLIRALKDVQARFLVIAFSSDWLYPPYQSKEIVRALKANQVDVSYVEIKSSYGHDAFLLEEKVQTEIIRGFLAHTMERLGN